VADFESTLEKVNDYGDDKNTVKYQKHLANSFGLKYNCIHKEYDENLILFNSPNPEEVSENFVLELENLAHKSYALLQSNKNYCKNKG
jgi:hypothetical protein